MSRVIAYRETNWMDEVCDRGYWHLVGKAYETPVTMFNPDKGGTPVIGDWEVVVIMDERGETDLEDFEHPEDCVYVFGRTHANNLLENIRHDHSVVINYPGDNCVFGITAVGITLNDRLRKQKCQ